MLFFLTHLATTEPYTLSLHDALPILAAVASLQDNPERAVRLFAAASSMLESSGSGWLHAYIPRVPCDDAALAALRSRAGDAAFGNAQAWGRSTGHRRAVEYALE